MNITKLIEYEEGWRSQPYLCSEGYPTVGFGFKLGPKGASLNQYQFTLPKTSGEHWLDALLANKEEAMQQIPWIRAALTVTNEARQAVLVSMAYQMGVEGLAKFKNALAAVAAENWPEAKRQLLDSRWARQTPQRAERHANQLLTGEWFEEY